MAYFAEHEKLYSPDEVKNVDHPFVKCIKPKQEYIQNLVVNFSEFLFHFVGLLLVEAPS